MADNLQDIQRRLVAGRKRDGRSVYDQTAKAELVALCRQSGASVSRLARECGVNANQLSRWLREHTLRRTGVDVASTTAVSSSFVAVAELLQPAPVTLHARLRRSGAVRTGKSACPAKASSIMASAVGYGNRGQDHCFTKSMSVMPPDPVMHHLPASSVSNGLQRLAGTVLLWMALVSYHI